MNDTVDDDAPNAAAVRPWRRARARLGGRLRGALLEFGFITADGGMTRRAAAVVAAVLLTVLVALHVQVQTADIRRHTDVLFQLAAVKLIDARWDVAVVRSRVDPDAFTGSVVQSRDTTRIQRALDAALAQAKSNVVRVAIGDLRKAYVEKASLVARFQQASADARQALEAAMRADAGVSGLVRGAWRDFPQRERLVAAENLVARVLAEAQQYHQAPSAAHRAALEAAAADLPRAHELPRSVEGALARLDSDVNQLLLLKPLEQMLGERLTVLDTGARADALAETFRRDLADTLARRNRYEVALLLYSALIVALIVYAGRAAYRKYRTLEAEHEVQGAELAEARERLREASAAVAEPGDGSASDVVDVNVRFLRRP